VEGAGAIPVLVGSSIYIVLWFPVRWGFVWKTMYNNNKSQRTNTEEECNSGLPNTICILTNRVVYTYIPNTLHYIT
jgi:hypothetical protein